MGDVFIGGSHPLLQGTPDYSKMTEDELLRKYQELQKRKEEIVYKDANKSKTPIWDEINNLMNSITDSEFNTITNNEEFIQSQNIINSLLNEAYLNILRPIVENTDKGKEVLTKHLELVKKLRKQISEENANNMALFREYTEKYSNMTYKEFLEMKKANK